MAKKTKSSPFGNFFKNAIKALNPGPPAAVRLQRLRRDRRNLQQENTALYSQINGGLINKDGSAISAEQQKVLQVNSSGDTIVDANKNESKIQYAGGLKAKNIAYNTQYKRFYRGFIDDESKIDELNRKIEELKKTELTGLEFSFKTVQNENTLIDGKIKKNKKIY